MLNEQLKKVIQDKTDELVSRMIYLRMHADLERYILKEKMEKEYQEIEKAVENIVQELDKLEEEAAEYQLKVLSELWDLRVQLNLAKMDGKDKIHEVKSVAKKEYRNSSVKLKEHAKSCSKKLQSYKNQYNEFLEHAKI